MSRLTEAREDLNEAEKELIAAGKEALGSTLAGIFESNPSITDIAWGQKHSEYNDEGMYPGIMGPSVNRFVNEDGDIDTSDWWEALYDRDGTATDGFKTEVDLLESTLNLIGVEALCKIIGDDEHFVVAYRDGGSYKLFSEYAGY